MTYLSLSQPRSIWSHFNDSRSLWSVLDAFDAITGDLRLPTHGWFEADESDTAYTFTLPLPGFSKDGVTVEVSQEGILSVSASRGGGKVEGSETKSGTLVSRAVTLPYDADLDKVEAKMEDGLLTVVVSKQAKPTPRKVTVN